MTNRSSKTSWKVGELASETGLSVRALRHYDQIGLLKPSSESEGGHRIYSTRDVEKLQKIMTLKQLGFSLDKIKVAIRARNFLCARRPPSCAWTSKSARPIWRT